MTDREWLARFEAEARATGDLARLRLLEIMFAADVHREINPDHTLAIIDQGRRLAQRLQEPWWELFFDDRRAGVIMKYKGDVKIGLELTVRNALEARKPQYAQFPWRFRINDHLVVGYLNSDPIGYADEVREALAFLERDIPDVGSPKYLMLARWRWLAGELGDLDEAVALAQRALAFAATDDDPDTARSHCVFCYSHLCEIAFVRQQWDELPGLALEGERLARWTGHQLELAEFQLWQALLALQAGDDEKARVLWRHAMRRVSQLGMPPDHIFFDALCAYHEQLNDPEGALEARERELATLLDKGRWWAEVRCRLRRCELLRRLERLTAAEVTATETAIGRLRKPEAARAELARVIR